MPVVGVSPEVARVALLLIDSKKRDAQINCCPLEDDVVTVTQFKKDMAYLSYHLGFTMSRSFRNSNKSESMKLLALIRTPVGCEIDKCPGCHGDAEINVPDPDERDDGMGNYRGMNVECPSCKGQGWLGRNL